MAQGVSLSITGSVHFGHSRKVVSARLLHWTVTVHLYFSKCVIWRYFETANILFLIKSLPISFSIYWCFLPEWIITKMVAKWWFSNDIISCAFISIRLYSGLLFFPFIICICDLRFPFYSVVCNHYCRCFDAQVVQVLPFGCILTAGFCVSLLTTSLLSGTVTYSRLSYFLCPGPGIRRFSKEFWLPFLQVVLRNRHCVPTAPGVTAPRPVLKTHAHAYICISVSV